MTSEGGSERPVENIQPQSSESKHEHAEPVLQRQDLDDFGLPTRPVSEIKTAALDDSNVNVDDDDDDDDDDDSFHDAMSPVVPPPVEEKEEKEATVTIPAKHEMTNGESAAAAQHTSHQLDEPDAAPGEPKEAEIGGDADAGSRPPSKPSHMFSEDTAGKVLTSIAVPESFPSDPPSLPTSPSQRNTTSPRESRIVKRDSKPATVTVSEWSHQRQIADQNQPDDEDEGEEVEWQAMPALGEFDIYNDDGRLVAKGNREIPEELNPYAGVGGAGKGYTRVQLDEDAQSATSMDDDTNYLFQNAQKSNTVANQDSEDDEQRDSLAQLQATKDLLTEGQRIAYVGVVRLTIHQMFEALGNLEKTRATRKEMMRSLESMDMWGQKMMVRLYSHMDISPAEQIMIEQLAEHGVQPADLVTPLMLNAKIENPLAANNKKSFESHRSSVPADAGGSTVARTSTEKDPGRKGSQAGEDVPEVHGPSDMPRDQQIELDLRWTVLCDLFLVLISDGEYDARSRRLLERVASALKITWVQICRFEKRVIDALEMQEEEAKENWDESGNMEKRRKLGLKRKYMVMGIATVGGGLIIGLSAGLLAPVIGAGLAAGFTTIGVTGTAGFLGGVGGAALITSAATAAGGTIAVRASDRRTGHVKTFEYRPLHNNKRLNLTLTISGWMAGKVDDVRLPYSTIDPIMGDIYSLLWEPEMLQSMGDTINILATEALTQTVQQVLGSTILVALMASIQLPIVLSKLAYLIDNPWSVSLDRANAAGLILADSLMDRHLGRRPITLLGFSLGSRVIFACLKELSRRSAYGLVQNVYLFGSPVVVKKDEWLRARSVVSGRFLNGYASNDWILGYLFRATSGGIMRVAGLAAVDGIPGVENVDVSEMVKGHMAYRTAMPRLMREVGWEVESDEFTEIEDPDPENHAKRQRELIQEIDDARKRAEEKPGKRRFGLFKRGKLAEKRGWETYNAGEAGPNPSRGVGQDPSLDPNGNVLFDIEAIRRELESEMIEVRELNSTLPPMQITSIQNGEKHIEYLRLPSNLNPEEVARMNLPPRPDEIDVDFAPPPPAPMRPARTSSLRPPLRDSPQPSPRLSPRISPSRTPRESPNPESRFSYDAYSEPRELVTTLPPLDLRRSPSPKPSSLKESTTARPGIKPEPSSQPAWNPSMSGDELAPRLTGLNIEHNAWADDGDNFGREQGGISMTFE